MYDLADIPNNFKCKQYSNIFNCYKDVEQNIITFQWFDNNNKPCHTTRTTEQFKKFNNIEILER